MIKDIACDKQELTIADQSGSIKLILWVEMKLRKVIHIYLQIPVIAQIDLVRNSFIDEEELTLTYLETVSKHVLCNKWNRKLNINKENLQRFVRCNNFNNNNRVKPSRSMYFLKIIFRKKDNKNKTLTLFHGNICSSSNILTKVKVK